MKITTLYTCTQCSHQSSKWLGRCPECEAWNSFTQEEIRREPASKRKIKAHARQPQEFTKLIQRKDFEQRWPLEISELDRVLGGGVVPGSLILLTGEPGIGKSTLTLQIAEKISGLGKKVLYISGEESEEQISSRGSRLGLDLKNLQLLCESNLETILSTAEEQQTEFLIVDSIQVVSSQNIPGASGSISQVRLCTEAILEFAKPKRLPVLLIGHVTKDGTLAGPRVLEHLVDTVLYLEGNRTYDVRLLRGVKNRFGSVSEVGIFEMAQNGLQEVKNPSEKFLSERQSATPGVALVSTMEGTRPLIVEVQALTAETRFGYPRRTASGFDVNRLQLLIAVIERHLNIQLGAHDVYVNVVGGLKIQDPACDLGICLAIVSSLKKKNLPSDVVFIGEVGLTGEIRKSIKTDMRKREAEKHGLKITPASGKNHLTELARELLRS
jgi:DNA repair protein RadA/Sms